MKSTGIVRKMDKLGRIVIPIELRKTLKIDLKDSLEIFTEDNTIVLRKYAPGCVFCGDASNIVKHINGAQVCGKCIERLKSPLL